MAVVSLVGVASVAALGQAAPVWPANGVALAMLLAVSPRHWTHWAIAAWVGSVAAGVVGGVPLPVTVVLGLCNLFEVAFAYLLIRRFVGRFDPGRVLDLSRFFGLAGVLAPLVASCLAAVAVHFLRGGTTFVEVLKWAAADGLGIMIITPLMLTLRDLRERLRSTPMTARAAVSLLGVVAVGLAVSLSSLPLYFLLAPAMLLAVFQLEVAGAALAVLTVVAMGFAMAALGHYPLVQMGVPLADRFIVGQVFLACLVLTSYLTAAVLAQRRELKGKLDEQYRRVKLAEEIAGVGYWRFDYQTQTLDWSDVVRRAYGFDRDATGAEAVAGLHPDDREEVVRLIREVRETGEERALEYRLVSRTGEVRQVVGSAAREVAPDGRGVAVMGAFFDVTELRQAQEEVVEREARYRLLADAATDVVLKADKDDVLSYVSPAARRYGYEPEDLIGVSGYSLVHPDDVGKLRAIVADLFSGRPVDPTVDRTYRLRTADGRYIWMEGNPAIIRDEAGRPVSIVSQLRDITQRKAMEAELHAAREAAEAAAAVKADFMANMSHELRTPLTSVLGFTNLALNQPDLSDTTRRHIEKASNAGAALLTIVNDILDFSRLESGRLQIRPQPCDLDALCRSTLELFGAQAEEKGVQLRYAAEGLPAHLTLDPERVRQVLLNLVGNAVKFSDRGAVRLTASWRAGRLRIAVEDDGPGIAPDQQALLFRRFSQVDGSATRRHGGTGLGLAICLGLVEAMDGEIGVRSEVGEGATFFFELPAEAAAAEAEDVSELPAIPPGVRLLVADDHAVNRELVRAIPHTAGRGDHRGRHGRRSGRRRQGRAVRPHPDGPADARARRPGRHDPDPRRPWSQPQRPDPGVLRRGRRAGRRGPPSGGLRRRPGQAPHAPGPDGRGRPLRRPGPGPARAPEAATRAQGLIRRRIGSLPEGPGPSANLSVPA
ncbi:PAS domain S-box protein [Phenylobacterium sp. J367]|nr:PAS domain S-box protein [Phenylobacterium sp. J367]